jgi:hypothetical protein
MHILLAVPRSVVGVVGRVLPLNYTRRYELPR